MSRKSYDLYMSALPIVIIVAVILGAGFLMTRDDIKLPFLSANNRIEVRRIEGFPTIWDTQKDLEKQRLVIKSQEELDTFLKYTELEFGEKIDFNKEYLLVASTKTLGENGHKIKIDRVYKDTDDYSLLVKVEEFKPGELCVTDPWPNIAVDIAAISKTDKKIEFERIKKTDDECHYSTKMEEPEEDITETDELTEE
jgi:hypothetical protein